MGVIFAEFRIVAKEAEMALKRDDGVKVTLPDGRTKMNGTIWYFIEGKAWVSLKFALSGCSPPIAFDLAALVPSNESVCAASGAIPPNAGVESLT